MSDIYSKLKSTGSRMIQKYGRQIQLIKITKSEADYNPVLSELAVPVYALCSDYNVGEIDGTLIQVDDKKYLLAADIAPSVNDMIQDGDRRLSIIRIKEEKPGNSTVYYEVQARA